jgi:hypothetical protein
MPARDLDQHVRRALVNDGWTRTLVEDPLGQLLLAKGRAKLMIYSDEKETIRQWTPEPPTAK